MAVVGDGRSGDPLHERDDKRDVYKGEVAMVDSVSELVRRVDGVVDGLRPLVDVYIVYVSKIIDTFIHYSYS